MSMFKIGQTSGVAPSTATEGEELIDVDEEYLGTMAKSSEDLPEASIAPTKVIEVTDGCFSETESEVTDVATAEGTDAETAEEAEDADTVELAQMNEVADAQPAPEPNPAETTNQEKQFQLSDLNPFYIVENLRTGAKIVKTRVPKLIPELINDIPYTEFLRQKKLSRAQFEREYCNNNPYPECAACKLSRTKIDAFDIHAMLTQIANGINALLRGGTNLFDCPGQLNAMLQNKLGPLGMVIGPAASACIIGLTAVRGALVSFDNIARSLMRTDMRAELGSFLGHALRSGGGSTSFISLANSILNSMGTDPYSLFTGTSIPRIGGYTRPSSRRYSTNKRRQPSKESKEKANKALAEKKPALDGAKNAVENPGAAKAMGLTVPASQKDPHVACTDEFAEPGVKYSVKVGDTFKEIEVEPGQSLESLVALYGTLYTIEENGLNDEESPDEGYAPLDPTEPVKEGATYFFKDGDTVKQVPQEVLDALGPTATIADIITYINAHMAELGVENPITDVLWDSATPYPAEPTYDVVPVTDAIDASKTYYYESVGGGMIAVDPTIIAELLAENPSATIQDLINKLAAAGDTVVILTKSESGSGGGSGGGGSGGGGFGPTTGKVRTYRMLDDENTVSATTTYYYAGNTGNLKTVPTAIVETVSTSVNNTVADLIAAAEAELHEEIPILLYCEEYDVDDLVPHNKEYSGSAPLVLDNGLMVKEPICPDAAQMQNCIETKNLVTDTQVLASEMAKMNGIGLTVEEISMAYILDHEVNGSNIPADVRVMRIPTALDALVV